MLANFDGKKAYTYKYQPIFETTQCIHLGDELKKETMES